MNKKTDIIIIAIVVVCIVGYIFWFNKKSDKSSVDTTVNVTTEANKKAAAQSVNPFNTQTTNPLNNVETNPLNKVKVNPFQ